MGHATTSMWRRRRVSTFDWGSTSFALPAKGSLTWHDTRDLAVDHGRNSCCGRIRLHGHSGDGPSWNDVLHKDFGLHVGRTVWKVMWPAADMRWHVVLKHRAESLNAVPNIDASLGRGIDWRDSRRWKEQENQTEETNDPVLHGVL